MWRDVLKRLSRAQPIEVDSPLPPILCCTVNHPRLCGLFYPTMSVKKLRLTCLVWPDDKPDEHSVEVKIDNDETVAALKKLIKAEYAHRLHNVDAPDLVLWKCSGLPDDDNLEHTLKTIRFDGSDVRLVYLHKSRQRISQIFGDEALSKEPIHILVEVLDHGECYCFITSTVTCILIRNIHNLISHNQSKCV